MRIILQKTVEKLGTPGTVVEVADGYARNYLIPRGLAAPASKGGIRHAERLKQGHDVRIRKELTEAHQLAERLSKVPLRIRAKAGAEGKLFGSITVADVADELQKVAGIPVDRKRVHLAETIRSVGTHEVTVHLHPEVNASVTVEVLPQK
jgi:large subunit ribosomal protein L9